MGPRAEMLLTATSVRAHLDGVALSATWRRMNVRLGLAATVVSAKTPLGFLFAIVRLAIRVLKTA
jgi:hypothetical protein